MSSENCQTADPGCKPGARLKRIGAIVLALGMSAAAFVYWHGTRPDDFSHDPSMAGFHRNQTRQMGVLFGKSGQMADDLIAALKDPRVQAALIAGLTITVALSCFYLGRGYDHSRSEHSSDTE